MSSRSLPLQDAFWFQEGPGVRKWQFRSSGIKLLNVGNILAIGDLDLSKTDRYLAEDEVDSRYKHFLVDEGDLVIASSGISFDEDGLLRTRGAFIRRNDLPLCLNTSTIRFKPKHGADLRYLRFWLDSYEFRAQISRLVTGSAQQNFGPSHLENIQITLPSLAEQQRIARLLEQTDRLRRTRRYALELSDTFLPAAFLELFGSGETFPNRTAGDLLDEGVIVKIQDGNHGESYPRASEFSNEGIPFLSATNVTNGEVHLMDAPRLPEERAKLLRIGWIEPNDILLAHNATVGRVAVVPYFEGKAVIGTSLTFYRVNNTRFLPGFFARMLRSRFYQAQLENVMKQSTRNQVPVTRQLDLRLFEPPIHLQERFVSLVSRHERLRAGQREALRQAEHLFQSLLHQAFTVGI